jgi:hypothetical protein
VHFFTMELLAGKDLGAVLRPEGHWQLNASGRSSNKQPSGCRGFMMQASFTAL